MLGSVNLAKRSRKSYLSDLDASRTVWIRRTISYSIFSEDYIDNLIENWDVGCLVSLEFIVALSQTSAAYGNKYNWLIQFYFFFPLFDYL